MKKIIQIFILILILILTNITSQAYTPIPINKQSRTANSVTAYESRFDKFNVSKTGILVWVNLKNQRMTVFKNKKFVTSYQVMTGADKSPTVQGAFKINSKIFRPNDTYSLYTKKGDIAAKISYWIPFSGNLYAFHNASWRQFSEFGNTKRRPEGGSHGCVNMSYADIEEFYKNYANIMDTVYISNG
jgi:lipoprotein-anchoring transpeptidase ErfK/SrfK